MNRSVNFFLVACALTVVDARRAVSQVDVPKVIIERSVHFRDVKGADVVIPPGVYAVEWTVDDQIRLRSLAFPFDAVLRTNPTSHNKAIAKETALSLQIGLDEHRILMLLPDRTALEAVGSYSQPKRLESRLGRLTQARLNQALSSQLQITNGPPPPVLTSPPPNHTLASRSLTFEWRAAAGQPASAYYEICVTVTGSPCTSGDAVNYRWMEDANRVTMPVSSAPSSGTPITGTRFEIQLRPFFQSKPLEWLVRACAPGIARSTLGSSAPILCTPSSPRALTWAFAPPTLSPVSRFASHLRPTFDWSVVPAAESYLFCISAAAVPCPVQPVDGSQTLVIATDRFATSYTPPSDQELNRFSGQTVQWTAAACSTSIGCLYQQNVQSVRIGPPPPPQGFVKSPIELYRSDRRTQTPPFMVFCGNSVKESTPGCLSKATGPNGNMPAYERVEVRGWVVDTPHFIQGEEEFGFSLLLDHGWAPDALSSSSVTPYNTAEKINRAITPHNVIAFGNGDQGGLARLSTDANIWGGTRAMVVHVEVNGWGPERMKSKQPPRDWVPVREGVAWPFNPDNPPAVHPGPLATGDYVRLVGTLWEDEPHRLDGGNSGDEGKDAKGCWRGGSTGQGAFGRGYFEIHPVDYMAKIDRDPANDRAGALHVIAMCGDGELTRELVPPGPRPSPNSVVEVEELVDDEFTVWRSVKTQNRVTKTSDTTAQVHVRIETGGWFGHGAKFKAMYRVFWR